MKNYFFYAFLVFSLLNGQSAEQIKQRLKDAGINKEKASQMLREQGYSEAQIKAEAESRGFDLNKEDISDQEDTGLSIKKDDKSGLKSEIDKKDEEVEKSDVLIEESTSEYFGYNIFEGDPATFQASVFGAVDPNYNIGPGDEIILMLWGESQFRQEFVIDREGYVFLPEIGQVFVNGLTLEDLEKKFFQILSKVYSTLNPLSGKPTTFIDISLGDLRPLRIIVLGEVKQPGSYSVSPSTSLSSALYYFGGPKTNGSLRDIRLIRKGKMVAGIDFYDYLLYGNTPNDIRLQRDDIVFIPPRGKTVSVYGEIKRQGIYELKDSENLIDLIKIAGDLKMTAYMNRAQIRRIVAPEERMKLNMERMIIDINLEEELSKDKITKIMDGDTLKIFSISNHERNIVILNGSSVIRPGKFQYNQGMTIKSLIELGEGLSNDAYLDIAHLIRLKEDLTSEIISINLRNELEGENEFFLNRMDKLVIYNNNSLKNTLSTIIISGPVKNPGTYFYESNSSIGDAILLSGGFKENINKVKLTVARINPTSFNPQLYLFPERNSKENYFNIDELSDPNNYVNKFTLKFNDIINIYSDPRDDLPEIVHIDGAVFYPGDYPILSKNEKVSDIIKRAGGLLPEAYPMASNFIRSGNSIQLSFQKIINNPRSKENFNILHGDTIKISKYTNIVKIVGEVNNPGVFKYFNNYSVRNYIQLAGGLTVNAEKREIWVTHPDGTSNQFKQFYIAPKVYDGSIISIGKEIESEPFDATEYANEITSIVSNLAQVLLLYSALKN